MGRSQYEWNESKYKRFLKEGRGAGQGKDYRPWLTIQDVSSSGRRHRVRGWKTERIHHLMSDHEYRYFCMLEWSDGVRDIREQFPLDLEATQEIARQISVKHPVAGTDLFPVVLTTDFHISIYSGHSLTEVARTVKHAAELEKQRTIEKLEIERRYWEIKGIDWGIVTEKDIPRPFADNIDRIQKDYWLESSQGAEAARLLSFAELLKQRIRNGRGTFLTVTKSFDEEMNLDIGTSIKLLKYLIARKQIRLDFNEKLDFSKSVNSVTIIESELVYQLRLA